MDVITCQNSQPCGWLTQTLVSVFLAAILGYAASEVTRRRTLQQERAAAKERRVKEFGYFMAGLRAELGEQQYQAKPTSLPPRYAQMRVEIQKESFLVRGNFDPKFNDCVKAAVGFKDSDAETHEGIKKIQVAFDKLVEYTNPAPK